MLEEAMKRTSPTQERISIVLWKVAFHLLEVPEAFLSLFMPWRWKYLQYRPTPIGRLSVYCLHKFTGKMYGMPVLD